MMKTLSLTVAAAAFLAAGTMGTMAAQKSSRTLTTNNPPHASTTGLSHRSPNARLRGANRPGFCPPGQAKKQGNGSAFRC